MPRGTPSPCTRKCCRGTRRRRDFLCDPHWDALPGALRILLARAPDRATRDRLRRQAHAALDQAEAEAARRAHAAQRHTATLLGERDEALAEAGQ